MAPHRRTLPSSRQLKTLIGAIGVALLSSQNCYARVDSALDTLPGQDGSTKSDTTRSAAVIGLLECQDVGTTHQLQGFVYEGVNLDPSESLKQLVDSAYSRSELANQLDKKGGKHQRGMQKVWVMTKDMAQWATTCKGFEQSSEAADVILDEKIRLKSQSAIAYAKQKQMDELHTRLMSALMQLAMGIGMPDKVKGEHSIQRGTERLAEIVGENEAKQTVETMRDWAEANASGQQFANGDLETRDIFEMQKRSEKIMAGALEGDDVVKEIRTQLHRYNKHSNLMRFTAKMINTTLSIAAFTPTFVSPAAQLAQMAFISATGGPEEAKLLKELYLDRRLTSRLNSLMSETSLLVSNHNLAVVTQNPVLLKFTEDMIEQMTSKEVAHNILYSPAESSEEKTANAAENPLPEAPGWQADDALRSASKDINVAK